MKVAIILKAPSLNEVVSEDNVIYADAGYKFKDIVGEKNVLAVVGDFDSLGAPPKNEKIVSLEVEKNFTDGERAIRLAKELGADEVVIYGAYGGKIEHVLGNIALLKIARSLGIKASIKDSGNITELFCGEQNFEVKKGGVVSLIPYAGNCRVKNSSGLYYPLDNLVLTSADTRGISNLAIDDNVSLNAVEGECLIIYERK